MSPERTALRVPELPESVADATVMTLYKQPGDRIRRDEPLVELETDKVVLEVPAPADGILDEYTVAEGAVVTADTVLGFITPGAADETGESPPAPKPVRAQPEPATPAATETPDDRGAAPSAARSGATSGATSGTRPGPPPSPAVRRRLTEHGLAGAQVEGTGPEGRLLKEDVERVLAHRDRAPAQAQAPAPRDEKEHRDKQEPRQESPSRRRPEPDPTAVPAARQEERVPLSRLRARIAERLLEATQTTAMLTTFNEIDLSEVIGLRARHKEDFEARHGVRLGFMSFFVRACAEALRRFPIVNAALDGNQIVYHHYCDIGIAVSSPRGLVVPVLRDAETLSLAAVEKQTREFAERARDGRLDLDDLRGGTFTITNGGVFGSLLSTPILNPPQSAILGMHALQERPVAHKGQVVIRPMMYVALSYDHRLIDGADAVRFLVTIKRSLEDPGRMLLDL
jgi:2-oxoglutarate dehydrogenase E2 component (dihydrolipoamide succinyltransferase)